jgi:threonylcarbamoyladenosine tRNA methylthiotransferase MtaB
MPHAAIGVDVIVGFPSETEADFKETFDFLHSLDISYLHVFTYSERDNTQALSIRPVVPLHTRHERNKILRNLSYMKMQYFIQQHEGQTRKVLFERNAKNACLPGGPGMMEGYTDNYIKITTPYKADWANEIVEWKI